MFSRSTIVNRSMINFHSMILNALREFAKSDLRSSRTPNKSSLCVGCTSLCWCRASVRNRSHIGFRIGQKGRWPILSVHTLHRRHALPMIGTGLILCVNRARCTMFL